MKWLVDESANGQLQILIPTIVHPEGKDEDKEI